jgi:hypothetical protein
LIRLDHKLNVTIDRVAEPRRPGCRGQKVPDSLVEGPEHHIPIDGHRINRRPTHLFDDIRILTDTWIREDISDHDGLERTALYIDRRFVHRVMTTSFAFPPFGRLE